MVKQLSRNLRILAAREAGASIEGLARAHRLTAVRIVEIIRFEKLRRELCPRPLYLELCQAAG